MNKTVFNASGLQESQVLANFEVEELEKRYEMGWFDSVDVDVTVSIQMGGTWDGHSTPSFGGGGSFGLVISIPIG